MADLAHLKSAHSLYVYGGSLHSLDGLGGENLSPFALNLNHYSCRLTMYVYSYMYISYSFYKILLQNAKQL